VWEIVCVEKRAAWRRENREGVLAVSVQVLKQKREENRAIGLLSRVLNRYIKVSSLERGSRKVKETEQKKTANRCLT